MTNRTEPDMIATPIKILRTESGITKMTTRKRLWSLLPLVVAVGAMILLSAGLSRLELLPGGPFTLGAGPAEEAGEGGKPVGSAVLELVFRLLLIIAGLLLPLALIYFIISPTARKRVLKDLLLMLPLLIVSYLLVRRHPGFLKEQEGLLAPETMSEAFPSGTPVEFVANPPQWLVFVANLGFALLVASLLVGASLFFWRRKRQPVSPLKQLAQEAEEALDALQAGADLRNTVIRCYLEMNRFLSEQRGIRRESAMTPREFEQRLTEMGLPGEQVRQLTRLFEKVRYGAKMPDEDEEHQAIACLTAIVEFCRGVR